MNETAIVGGGLSGLSAAFFLNQLDIPVKVYEKTNWGGTLFSQTYNNTHLESGADVFYLDNPLLLHLCSQLNISDKLVYIEREKSRVSIVKEQTLYRLPETPKDMWKTSLIFFVQKIKLFFAMKKKYSFWPNMTVYDAAKNIFGESFAEIFASGFTRLAFHNEAEDIEIASALSEIYRELPQGKGTLRDAIHAASVTKKNLWEKIVPPEIFQNFEPGYYKIEGGLEVLTNALKENLVANPINQNPLMDDNVKELLAQDGKVLLKAVKAKAQLFTGVLLTIPPSEIAKLLKNFDGESSETFAQMESTSHTRVTCAWNKKDFHPAGYGVTVPRKEKLFMHCETYLSNLCPERCPDDLFITRTIVSGDNRLMDDEQLVSICTDFRKKVHGQNIHPQWHLVEHKSEQPLYAPGHHQTMEQLKKQLQAIAPVYFSGRHYNSPNVSELVASSFMIARDHANR